MCPDALAAGVELLDVGVFQRLLRHFLLERVHGR
jgi:hypothetical protein